MAWCPLSLFAGVIYTEGLYLLLSTAALRAFDKQQYGWTTFGGQWQQQHVLQEWRLSPRLS